MFRSQGSRDFGFALQSVSSGLLCPVNGVVPELTQLNGLPVHPSEPGWKMPVVLGGRIDARGGGGWFVLLPPSLLPVSWLRDAHAQDSGQNTP